MQNLQPISGSPDDRGMGWGYHKVKSAGETPQADQRSKKGATRTMGCCNGKRTHWTTTAPTLPAQRHQSIERTQLRTVSFEYTGETGISVLGPITRMRYNFPAPGAQVEVDQRDAAYVAGVPKLRRTK
jgi:hypothetical protein